MKNGLENIGLHVLAHMISQTDILEENVEPFKRGLNAVHLSLYETNQAYKFQINTNRSQENTHEPNTGAPKLTGFPLSSLDDNSLPILRQILTLRGKLYPELQIPNQPVTSPSPQIIEEQTISNNDLNLISGDSSHERENTTSTSGSRVFDYTAGFKMPENVTPLSTISANYVKKITEKRVSLTTSTFLTP
jgi:hypothetical protein